MAALGAAFRPPGATAGSVVLVLAWIAAPYAVYVAAVKTRIPSLVCGAALLMTVIEVQVYVTNHRESSTAGLG